MKITAQTTILEVLKAAPQARKVLERHKLRCRGCQGSAAETVQAAALNHGLDPAALVKELNEAARTAE